MPRESIAVVGSGMAGLTAAWLCQRQGHEVSVYEAQNGRGMDAHAALFEGTRIDIPLRIMQAKAWSSVLELAAAVGVETYPVSIHVSCSWLDRRTWLRSGTMQWFGKERLAVGSWRHYHLKSLRVLYGLRKLERFTQRLAREDQPGLTIAQAMEREGFDPLFWRGLLLPLLSTICTCRSEYILGWPARQLLLLTQTVAHERPLLRLRGGTKALVDRLVQGLRFYSGSPVTHLAQSEGKILLSNARGERGLYDRVIVATQANQTGFLDPASFPRERAVLERFVFDRGELLVHNDESLMPEKRSDWTALNYSMDRSFERSMFTIWVNAVEPNLAGARPVFQTWNPLVAPDPALTLQRIPLQRAIVNEGSIAAQQQLELLHQEAGRRVFFCGSWAAPGVPLLESAVRSALAVAEQIARKQSPAGAEAAS